MVMERNQCGRRKGVLAAWGEKTARVPCLLAPGGEREYRLVMNRTRLIPVPGTCIEQYRFKWIARFMAGIVLAHLLLMASGPHAVASGEKSQAKHLAMRHLIERNASNETGNSVAAVGFDHHCSPLAGDIVRYDPVLITPPGVIAPIPQERAPSALEYPTMEPHPPDRSVFQVFLD
jgi:hypothetical protein